MSSQIDIADSGRSGAETEPNEVTSSVEAPARRSSLRSRGASGCPSISSDLTSGEPVTKAEIALVLAMLGGTIGTILRT